MPALSSPRYIFLGFLFFPSLFLLPLFFLVTCLSRFRESEPSPNVASIRWHTRVSFSSRDTAATTSTSLASFPHVCIVD